MVPGVPARLWLQGGRLRLAAEARARSARSTVARVPGKRRTTRPRRHSLWEAPVTMVPGVPARLWLQGGQLQGGAEARARFASSTVAPAPGRRRTTPPWRHSPWEAPATMVPEVRGRSWQNPEWRRDLYRVTPNKGGEAGG